MNGLVFETQAPVVASEPNRVDITCFVGFVGRRDTPVPAEIQRWLEQQGWTSPPYGRAAANPGVDGAVPSLEDLPIPLDSWDLFDYLFAWERRPLKLNASEQVGTTYLGAAIRSFFAQGGRRCYVVRVGNPWAFTISREERLDQIAKLIPGYRPRVWGTFIGSPAERQGWHGVGHLFGLPDVSFLCLPDLPDAVSIELPLPDVRVSPPQTPEQFVECSEPEPPPPPDSPVRLLQAPRCDELGYREWARALNLVANLLARQLREVQLVAGVPIPQVGTAAEQNLWKFLTHLALSRSLNEDLGLSSAFLQLVYPWVRTPGSANLPKQLENPDAVLVGILARNALTRGIFRSAANLNLADVYELFPVLSPAQIFYRQKVEKKNTIQEAYDLNLMSLQRTEALPTEGKRLVIVAKIRDFYHVRIFDRNGNKLIDKGKNEFFPDEKLVQQLDAALSIQSSGQQIDNQTKNELLQKITSSLDHPHSLIERGSFFGPTPDGLRLLSDVTTSLDESYRPASVNRLVSALVRTARRLGEDLVFEASGQRLWSKLRESLNGLLLGLYRVGALRGATLAEAFRVRCDRTTMTQNDIDAGRVIVEIQFAPTVPIERITVVLAMSDGGQLVRRPTAITTQEAA